jgi:diguanylate cyclase (GGDEF)-like protein
MKGETIVTRVMKKGFRSPLIRNTLLALLLWTLGAAGSMWWNNRTVQQQNLDLAKTTALGSINKDIAFRIWAASHGGVYVTPDERTPPNPYLAHVPDRDVITTGGKRLTLINPAYMLRLVMGENSRLFGVKGHLTSLQLTNPANQPDGWEQAALESFRQGVTEATTVVDIDGKPHLRMIRPLQMEKGCLMCHADTGVKLGEVRGGISVSIPMEPIYSASRAHNRDINLFHGAAWLLGMGLIGLVAWGSKRESAERERAEQAEERASHDGLTGLYNHRTFYSILGSEIIRAQRFKHPASLLMLDIDHFKRVNDSYGHQAGDDILRGLSAVISQLARGVDSVCRYGGEEIAIVLPETALEGAAKAAERIRSTVEQHRFEIGGGSGLAITVSIGVAAFPAHAATAEALVAAADQALYRAKDDGRNRACCYEEPGALALSKPG